ncbi:Ppx/GppA family phosphatase [Hyphomicrobiaceae bacterium 22]|uniref:Ppx/GppA family phosphatase n=1 Tax=Prosthecodimorpha staleyi TaxID=2840188 RepID=A0A947D086_9HYPH|nr:Ppx/GppA family phosphatase [Prosthecodimorpha staleyi]
MASDGGPAARGARLSGPGRISAGDPTASVQVAGDPVAGDPISRDPISRGPIARDPGVRDPVAAGLPNSGGPRQAFPDADASWPAGGQRTAAPPGIDLPVREPPTLRRPGDPADAGLGLLDRPPDDGTDLLPPIPMALAHHHPAERHIEPGHHHPHERAPVPRRMHRYLPLYAALDLGTNNCRLLVAEPQRHGFRVVDAFSRIVRLGEGISHSGRLSEAAQDRALEALRICRAKLDLRGVERARLVATEACRIAANGSHFLERVYEETGLELEIVSRETEARLAVAGCASLVDWQSDGVILFDIGGGSSELVWLDLARGERTGDLTRHIRAWTSLPVGVVTLSERHGGVFVDETVFEAMVGHVDDLLETFDRDGELERALREGRFHMLGTSGTVTTLAGVHLGLKRYDRRRVDGTWLDDDDVSRMIDHLVGLSFDERVANPCIGSDRADLVLAGCAILEAIRRRWPCRRLRVADRGLREGILTELMAADGMWRR